MTRALLLFATAIGFVAIPAQAQRWERGEVRQTTVPIGDLDLSNPAGIDTLNRRLDRAVRRVCDSDRVCRDEAWDSSYDQVTSAIERDRRTRRLAEEREAQLRGSVYYEQDGAYEQNDAPPPPPAYYAPPPPPRLPVYVPSATTTVITVTTGGPAPRVEVYTSPR